MLRKYANQEEPMLPKYTQKQESTGTSILNGSCIGPTYGSNNFTRAVPSGPSNAKLTEPSKVTVNKNLHKKPPRMRRENREEIEKRPFWNFFR